MATIILHSTCIKCGNWINKDKSYHVLDLNKVVVSVISEIVSPGSITESDYICPICCKLVYEIVKGKVAPPEYEEAVRDFIFDNDPLKLKPELTWSDDEETGNNVEHNRKKIKLEADQDKPCEIDTCHNNDVTSMNVDPLSIDTENCNGNEHTNVKEECNIHSGEESENGFLNNEPISLNKDPLSLSDEDCHEKEPVNVKEEPLGITEEEDIESLGHDDEITIKEEPFNKYDEHIEINYNNIESQDLDSEHTIKDCDETTTEQKENSLGTFDVYMQRNHNDIEGKNLIKDPLLMCDKEVTKKKDDLLDASIKNKTSIYHEMKAANSMEDPLKIFDEDLNENPLSTSDKNISQGEANPKEDTQDHIGNEDLRKNNKLRSTTYSIEADPHHISEIHNYARTNNLCKVKQTVKKYGCLLCGYPVLKRQSKLIFNRNAIDLQLLGAVIDNSTNWKITGTDRICLYCMKRNAKNIQNKDSNISNITQIQQTSSQDISNVNNDYQSGIPAKNIETVTIPTDSESESNADEIDEGSHMMEEYLDSSPTEDINCNKSDTPSEHSPDEDPEWKPKNYKAEILKESTSSRSEGKAIPKPKGSIRLPNITRSPHTAHRCVFAKCQGKERRLWNRQIRGRLLKDFNFYVPPCSRVCKSHYNTDNFDDLLFNSRCIEEFNEAQIEDIFALLKSNRLISQVNFENIMTIDNSILENWMGITRQELRALVDKVPQLHNIRRGMFGLAALLIKHHKKTSTRHVVKLLNIPRTTLEGKMRAVTRIFKNNGDILEAFFSSKTKTETSKTKSTPRTKTRTTLKRKSKTTPKTRIILKRSETTPKTKTEITAKTKIETALKVKNKTNTKSETASKTETTPETITDSSPETKTETTPETKTGTTPETKTESTPETKTGKTHQTKSKTTQEPKSETTQQTKSETNQQTKSETNQQTKIERTQETKTEKTQETKTEITQQTKTETTQQTKTETTQQTKTETTQQTKTETTQQTKTETTQQTKTETTQQTESETTPEKNTKTSIKRKSETSPKTKTTPKAKTDTIPKAKTDTIPKAKIETTHKTKIETSSKTEKSLDTKSETTPRTKSETTPRTETKTALKRKFETTPKTKTATTLRAKTERKLRSKRQKK